MVDSSVVGMAPTDMAPTDIYCPLLNQLWNRAGFASLSNRARFASLSHDRRFSSSSKFTSGSTRLERSLGYSLTCVSHFARHALIILSDTGQPRFRVKGFRVYGYFERIKQYKDETGIRKEKRCSASRMRA